MKPSTARLRIAMLGTRGIPANYGGFETCVEEVAPRLAALGHDVTVYCRVPPIDYPGDVYRGVRLVKLPTVRNKYLDTVAHTSLAALHAALSRYDVVIVFGVGNSPQALALRLTGLPVLLNVDGLDWRRAKWPAPARFMLKQAERLAGLAATRTITDSLNVLAYYREHYGKELEFIPYGASPGTPELNGQLARLGLEPDSYFLYVGRLEPENRVLDLVEAARRAHISREVVIVGDAPYADGYKATLRARGDGYVQFPGAIYGQGYWELNHHAHAYIFPVASDGTHPALIEAMACGNPVLARDIPDNRGVGGDAVRYFSSVDELVELMEWADRAGDELRQLGKAAQQRAATHFNWDRVTGDYLALARSVTERPATQLAPSTLHARQRDIVDWLARLAFDEASASAVPEGASSTALIEQIALHGLGPLLGERVCRGTLHVSAGVDAFLAQQVERNRLRLRLLRRDLDRVLAALARDRIEGIPLKGSAMLLERPDEVEWRPMADIDLLVRHPVQQEVDLAYAHAGYCLTSLSWKHRVYGLCDAERPESYEIGEHPEHPRDVESHEVVKEAFRGFQWDLTPWIINNLDERDGASVPNAQAMSLHLAVHASMALLESTGRIIQIVDLSRQLALTGPDSILTAVFKSGARQHARFAFPALALAARWSADPRIAEAVEALRPYVPPGMATWIRDSSFHDLSWSHRSRRPLMNRLAVWAFSPGEQARMARATLLPSPYQLAGAGYPGEWPLAVPGWYRQHYADLASRLRARINASS